VTASVDPIQTVTKRTQFQPTPPGTKTALMLKVERRLGVSLEDDYRRHYIEMDWGQRRLANRWRVQRSTIFGGRLRARKRTWVQILALPTKSTNTEPQDAPVHEPPACELCGADDVPLEGAHWISASEGGSATRTNILRLCPNCHTRLDVANDENTTERARAVLLFRAAKDFLERNANPTPHTHSHFIALCASIIGRKRIDGV